MRLRILFIPLAVLALMLAFAACGGDDEGAADDGGDAPAESGDPPDDGGDGDNGGGDNGGDGGDGTATVTIGGETWEFQGILCAFSTEETFSENTPFRITGNQNDDGTGIALTAFVLDTEPPVETSGKDLLAQIYDLSNNDGARWTTNTNDLLGGSDPVLEIDGTSVRIEAVFDDNNTADESETVPGTIDAECPATD